MFIFLIGSISATDIGLAKNSESAVLIEASTGKILFEKEKDKKMAPASMTKIMTMLLAMEAIENGKLNLEDEVLISKRAQSMGGTQIYVEAGSNVKVHDLLKGIGKFSGMNVVDVDGATGYIDTNFDGKAKAAINEFENGQDFVYIHVEAPDDCGHRHQIEIKSKSIWLIVKSILWQVTDYLSKTGERFKVLVTPDHATPLSLKTHTNDPVPFFIYDSEKVCDGVEHFNERTAKSTGYFIDKGYTLMEEFIDK